MGRGGLYYRQTFSPALGSQYQRSPAVALQPTPSASNLQEIASKAAIDMADSSATELLTELNRVKSRTALFPIVAVIAGIVICWMALTGADSWMILAVLLTAIVLAVYARHTDVLKGTAIFNYSLDADAERSFTNLTSPFRQLARSELVWHIDAAERNVDTKRNAGAATNLKRVEMRPIFSRPPRVQCNLEVPTLKAGRTTLYFFPDRLLLYDSVGVGAVPYCDLIVEVQESKFVEHGRVPGDSRQVDTTWQYVNKRGGPDRRFNNNRQIPVMQYGVIGFSSSSGLSALYMCSRSDIAKLFHEFPPLPVNQLANV
jgi:type IV secretory pathway VirB2 component (pilin)